MNYFLENTPLDNVIAVSQYRPLSSVIMTPLVAAAREQQMTTKGILVCFEEVLNNAATRATRLSLSVKCLPPQWHLIKQICSLSSAGDNARKGLPVPLLLPGDAVGKYL